MSTVRATSQFSGRDRASMAAIVFCVVSLTAGCNSRPQWTEAEKENVRHYENSQEFFNDAVKIVNGPAAPVPGTPFDKFTPEQGKRIKELNEKALAEARLVTDSVLAKVHPDLPKHFRDEYQRGLELSLSGEMSESLRGQKLIDVFVDWVNEHRKEIKVPK